MAMKGEQWFQRKLQNGKDTHFELRPAVIHDDGSMIPFGVVFSAIEKCMGKLQTTDWTPIRLL